MMPMCPECGEYDAVIGYDEDEGWYYCGFCDHVFHMED